MSPEVDASCGQNADRRRYEATECGIAHERLEFGAPTTSRSLDGGQLGDTSTHAMRYIASFCVDTSPGPRRLQPRSRRSAGRYTGRSRGRDLVLQCAIAPSGEFLFIHQGVPAAGLRPRGSARAFRLGHGAELASVLLLGRYEDANSRAQRRAGSTGADARWDDRSQNRLRIAVRLRQG